MDSGACPDLFAIDEDGDVSIGVGEAEVVGAADFEAGELAFLFVSIQAVLGSSEAEHESTSDLSDGYIARIGTGREGNDGFEAVIGPAKGCERGFNGNGVSFFGGCGDARAGLGSDEMASIGEHGVSMVVERLTDRFDNRCGTVRKFVSGFSGIIFPEEDKSGFVGGPKAGCDGNFGYRNYVREWGTVGNLFKSELIGIGQRFCQGNPEGALVGAWFEGSGGNA